VLAYRVRLYLSYYKSLELLSYLRCRAHNEPPVSTTTTTAAAVKLQDGVVGGRMSIATDVSQHSSAHACAAADAKLPGGVPAGVRQSSV